LDLERSFLSRLVSEGAVDKAVSFNITPDHFADPEVADVYETVVAHFRIHRQPPSKNAIRAKFPDFTFDPAEDALSWYMDEFIKDVKRRAAIDAQRRVAIAIQDRSQLADIEVIMIEAARMVSTLVPSSKITRFSEMESRIAEYERKAAAGENPGIMTGFKTINDLTYGAQPNENWVIAGPSGMGKSTLMQKMLFDFWVQEKTSLLVSMEMGADQLMRNWDAMAAELSRTAIKALGLGVGDIDRWRKIAKKAEVAKASSDIIVLDDVSSCSPDKIWAETFRHQPDIVAIDYIDLLDSPKGLAGWQAISYNAKQLKTNARVSGIPHLVVAQTNREGFRDGTRKENIQGSIGITQNCDVMIGLYKEDDTWDDQQIMGINVPKNRDGKGHGGFQVHWDPDKMEIYEGTKDEFRAKAFLASSTEPKNIYESA
jgi:replicative DNA helicase